MDSVTNYHDFLELRPNMARICQIAIQIEEIIEAETQETTENVQSAPQKLIYGTPEKRTEYTVSTQHNGYEMEGHVLQRTYFDNQVRSIGQSFYSDGQWHTTANIPQGIKVMQFPDAVMALKVAREDASRNGLTELGQAVKMSVPVLPTQELGSQDQQPARMRA